MTETPGAGPLRRSNLAKVIRGHLYSARLLRPATTLWTPPPGVAPERDLAVIASFAVTGIFSILVAVVQPFAAEWARRPRRRR